MIVLGCTRESVSEKCPTITSVTQKVTTCSDFPSDASLWNKEVEMVASLDELESSRSVCGKISKIRDVRRQDCFRSEQDHPEFPVHEEGQHRGAERLKRGSGFYEEDRSPS